MFNDSLSFKKSHYILFFSYFRVYFSWWTCSLQYRECRMLLFKEFGGRFWRKQGSLFRVNMFQMDVFIYYVSHCLRNACLHMNLWKMPHHAMLTVLKKNCGSIWKCSRCSEGGRELDVLGMETTAAGCFALQWKWENFCHTLSCPYHSHCLMAQSTIGYPDRTIQLQQLQGQVMKSLLSPQM